MKTIINKLNPKMKLIGGLIIVTTSVGTCSYEPPAEIKDILEQYSPSEEAPEAPENDEV